MTLLIPVQYHKRKYPFGISPKIKEVAANFDIEQVDASFPCSVHTEYSWGPRKLTSPIIKKFKTIQKANKNGVPQLWFNKKWAEEFVDFIATITKRSKSIKIIEIHPPFNDYCPTIDHFIEIYKTFEERILSIFPGVEILIENRFGSLYKGGKFLVASNQTKEDLIKDGISKEKIEITGIPVDLKFSVKHDKKLIEKNMHLIDKQLRVLVMGGGFGVGPFEYLLKNLAVLKDELSLVFICGYNQGLLDKLKVLSQELDFKVNLLGYADNVDELMQVSDLIITKAGGITLSESLVSGLPAIVINPIPGQEEGNAGYLASKGAVVVKKTPQAIVDFIHQIQKNKEILSKMKQSALEQSHPKAANKVLEIAKEII